VQVDHRIGHGKRPFSWLTATLGAAEAATRRPAEATAVPPEADPVRRHPREVVDRCSRARRERRRRGRPSAARMGR
jgi:hypothetical protein